MTDPRPTLEELFHEACVVPSPHVRLAELAAVREIVEHQLEAARMAEVARLRARHEVELPHPDDASLDAYEIEVQFTRLLPKVFRGGFLLAVWAALEACTKDLASFASKELGRALPDDVFHKGFIQATERAFTERLGISAFENVEEREALKRFAQVRAALVHHNGAVERLPRGFMQEGLAGLEAEGLYVERDLHHRYFVPKDEYVERQLALVDRHLRALADRVAKALRRRVPAGDRSS